MKVYGFWGTPCRSVDSPGFPKGVLRPVGVMRPDGVALPLGVIRPGVVVPSPKGLKLVTNTTGGDSVGAEVLGAAGVTSAAVVAGTYIGTDEMGLPMVGGGDTRGGGDTGGVLAEVVITVTGLRGLGSTAGGEGFVGGGRATGDAGEGLAMVMLRVVLALAGVVVPGAGGWVSGAVWWVGTGGAGEGVAVEAGGAEMGFTGWVVEGTEVTGGDVLMPAGFIAGMVMVDVTTAGTGAGGRVLTTTVPLDFWGAVESRTTLSDKLL